MARVKQSKMHYWWRITTTVTKLWIYLWFLLLYDLLCHGEAHVWYINDWGGFPNTDDISILQLLGLYECRKYLSYLTKSHSYHLLYSKVILPGCNKCEICRPAAVMVSFIYWKNGTNREFIHSSYGRGFYSASTSHKIQIRFCCVKSYFTGTGEFDYQNASKVTLKDVG